VGISREWLHRVNNYAEIALVPMRRNSHYCSDSVLSETAYMIGNRCLSRLRNYSGDMVVKPVHSVSILSSTTSCLLDVVFLCLKKVILLRCLPPAICRYVLASYFDIPLPRSNFEGPLASVVVCPDLIARMYPSRTDVTSMFLSIYPIMLSLTTFLHKI
jgi:hypothetical protein